MAVLTTIGKELLKDAVPQDMHADLPVFTKKTSSEFFAKLAAKHPEQYADILFNLSKLGAESAEFNGREASLGLDDIRAMPEVRKLKESVLKDIDAITQDPVLDPEVKASKVVKYLTDRGPDLRETVTDIAAKNGNSLAIAAKHGFRGNPVQLAQILFGDILVADHKGRPIPIPGLRGYGAGVTPMEYFAGSYGARQGFASVQLATAQGGYYAKLISLAAQRLKVTGKDCGAHDVGVPMKGDNPEILGYVLAKDVKGIPAGTVVEKKHLPVLGSDDVLVHSLLTCQMPEGVCQKCAGKREQGQFPAIGAHVGLSAASVVSEPITQILALCLAEGTEVRMADWSVKRIEDIQVGDMVMGCGLDGKGTPSTVMAVHDNGLRNCLEYTFELFGELNVKQKITKLVCTPDHKILTTEGLQLIGRELGDTLFTSLEKKNGRKSGKINRLYKITDTKDVGQLKTYDLTIDHSDHIFLLANGLQVSNSAKHLGGTVGKTDKRGIEELHQFTGVPERFQGAAALAPVDSTVVDIRKAPQGGSYVQLFHEGKNVHTYVPEGFAVTVKKGDAVEAGDVLSEGTPNPAEIAKYKGLGAGRYIATNTFNDILAKNNVSAFRRNVEAVMRGWMDRVVVTDPDGWHGFRVGEIVPYTAVASQYKPREDSFTAKNKMAVGSYLEKPVLYYTIGTRITPSIAKELDKFDIKEVTVNKIPAPFEPEIIRAMDIPSTDPDWKVQLTGFNLQKSLTNAAQIGSTSYDKSTSYAAESMKPTLI